MDETWSEQRFSDLRRLFSSKMVGHAYLFLGPGGRRKEEAVKELAQALLCSASGADEERPCHLCRSCRLFEAERHPDFHQMIADGGYIKVDQIREVCREVSYRPYFADRKLYFFPDLSQLTEVAANSFLMTLEEPPPQVVFMALAQSEAGILPTVLSRMQRINLCFVEGATDPEGEETKEESEFLAELAICRDLLDYLRFAEKWEQKGRLLMDRCLKGLLEKLRLQMLEAPTDQGNIHMLQATRRARKHLEANVNLRLLLEDLFLTMYEAKNGKGIL